MNLKQAAVLGASWLALAGMAEAQQAQLTPEERDARIQALEARLAELETQLNDLKESSAADVADVRRVQGEAVQVTLNNARPTFATPDGAFRAAIRGVFQFDAATYDQSGAASVPAGVRDLNAGTNFRRARIGVEGTAFTDWNYAITYETGGSGVEAAGLQQAWVEYAGWRPFGLTAPVRFRVGAFAVENTLEGATSNADQVFLERPSIAETVRGTFGGDGRSALGVYANGDRLALSAVLTGGLIGNSDGATNDEQTGAVVRAAWLPISSPDYGVHVGVNYSTIFQLPDATAPGVAGPATIQLRDRPELRVDGARLVDTGALSADGANAYGIELGAQWKNLLLTSEYLTINVDRSGAVSDNEFRGWYVQGAWALTGETRRWNAVNGGFAALRPANAFNPAEDHWGAFELAARYSVLDLNDNETGANPAATNATVRGGEQTITSIGLNWYPNNILRFMLQYQSVEIDRLNSTSLTQIGQDYDAFALRTQVSF